MEAIAAVASAVIALLALGVSIVVAMKQARIASEQTTIQERLAAIEEARRAEEVQAKGKARVTASLVPRTAATQTMLALHNEGPALARRVWVEPGTLPSPIGGLDALPVDLQPGQTRTFLVSIALSAAPLLRVTVRWTDDGGEHEAPYTLQL